VLLYATCSLSREHTALFDPRVTYTPNLAALAREGLVFEEHHAETGISGADFAAILAGVQVDRHHVYYHPRRLPDELTLLGESFAAAGYETWFWSGHPMASARRGYGQGVPRERWVLSDQSEDRRVEDRERQPDRTQLTANDERFTALLGRLARDPHQDAYVQVLFTVTHSPYHSRYGDARIAEFRARHPAFAGDLEPQEIAHYLRIYEENRLELEWNFPETARALALTAEDVRKLAQTLELCYRVAVSELDAWLGRTLEKVRAHGLEAETLLVFTADHGELLYRDNTLFHWTHGHELAPEFLRVPLVLRGPGVPSGRYAGVSRSIDLHPTLLGLCGLAALPGAVDGVDLSAAVRGEAAPPRLRAFCHTTLVSPFQLEKLAGMTLRNSVLPRVDPELIWVLVREGELAVKRQRAPDGRWVLEAYDWGADPEERNDLYDPGNGRHAELARLAEAYHARLVARYPERESAADVPAEEALEPLRALGYVR
jgi:arylsulfatase A-like enzyme